MLVNTTLKDSLYEAFSQDVNHIQSINIQEKYILIGKIISYKIKVNNKYTGYNFLSSIIEANQCIKQSDVY